MFSCENKRVYGTYVYMWPCERASAKLNVVNVIYEYKFIIFKLKQTE